MKRGCVGHVCVMGTLALALLALGGCPLDPFSPGDATGITAPTESGSYWIEYGDGELSFFRMPAQRGDSGNWTVVATSETPDWYEYPALYDLTDAGEWTLAAEGEDQTLDGWLQVWDPAPLAPTE